MASPGRCTNREDLTMIPKWRAGLLAVFSMLTVEPALADPVYMIAQIKIQDQETFFKKYGAATSPILKNTGAKILVATPVIETLEGQWSGNWTVVLEFPSPEKAQDWWQSKEYQESARPFRLNSTEFGNMVLAPAFEGFGKRME